MQHLDLRSLTSQPYPAALSDDVQTQATFQLPRSHCPSCHVRVSCRWHTLRAPTIDMAQDLFAQDAWTRARDRFIEDLSESERSLYHQSSLEMNLYDASAAQIRHQDTSTSRDLMSKLQPLISAIDHYGEALNVYANAYPLALSPLWGSLRVVLMVSQIIRVRRASSDVSAVSARVWQVF